MTEMTEEVYDNVNKIYRYHTDPYRIVTSPPIYIPVEPGPNISVMRHFPQKSAILHCQADRGRPPSSGRGASGRPLTRRHDPASRGRGRPRARPSNNSKRSGFALIPHISLGFRSITYIPYAPRGRKLIPIRSNPAHFGTVSHRPLTTRPFFKSVFFVSFSCLAIGAWF